MKTDPAAGQSEFYVTRNFRFDPAGNIIERPQNKPANYRCSAAVARTRE